MATTITKADIDSDLDNCGAVMTHTYYGRGFRPSNDELMANVIRAWQAARIISAKVIFVTDGEDVGFAPVKDDMVSAVDSEHTLLEDGFIMETMPVDNARHALLLWWELYGFASDAPEDWDLRRQIADWCDIDEKHLAEPQ